jgi:hypothetical protein
MNYSDTAFSPAATTARGPAIAADGKTVILDRGRLGQLIMDVVRRIRSAQLRAQTVAALSGLDAQTLRDIGVHDIAWTGANLAQAHNDNARDADNDNAREANDNKTAKTV